jgi:TPR repeat protein
MDIRELHQKAESGSTVAQCVLGICYLDGTEVQVDYQMAFRFLSAAANQGASRAVLNLARMHAEGLGIPRDPHKAIRLYESVGEVEFLAAIELGRIYSQGVGVAVHEANASRWYLAAVAQEDRVADCDELREAKAYLNKR